METLQRREPVAEPMTRWVGPPPFAEVTSARPDRCRLKPVKNPRMKSAARSGTEVKRSASQYHRVAVAPAAETAPVVQKPVPAVAAQRPPSTAQVLEQLLRKNLGDGHWRVALRRFFMLEYCDLALASSLSQDIGLLADRLTPREKNKMRADARAWADHVGLS